MCVRVGGDLYRGVPRDFLGGLQIFAGLAHERQAGVPEIVEADVRQARRFEEELLPSGTPVLLRTEKNDNWRRSFERWVAGVRTADGLDVSSELVTAGHGVWR